MSFICHIHNYTEYNQQWNVFSAFNPSKCTHLEQWAAGTAEPGSSRGFGALLKGLTSVVDNSCRSRDSNPQPRITSPTLYQLGHDCLKTSNDFLCILWICRKWNNVWVHVCKTTIWRFICLIICNCIDIVVISCNWNNNVAVKIVACWNWNIYTS